MPSGFTADVVARLAAVPGVEGLYPSSWPQVPPALVMSARVPPMALYDVIRDHYRSPDSPVVRPMLYVGEVSFAERVAPAQALVERALDRGVLIDVCYPVPHYRRLFIEMGWQGEHRFSAEHERWLRREAATYQDGAWPIEIQARPFFDSMLPLDVPPFPIDGPVPVGDRVPEWVREVLDELHERAAAVVGDRRAVQTKWEPWEIDPTGRIYVQWSDGPLVATVESALDLERQGSRRTFVRGAERIDVVVSRGLSQPFQLAALQVVPQLWERDFLHGAVRDAVAAEDVPAALVRAWEDQVTAEPLAWTLDDDELRSYLRRHGDAVRRAAGP
jgi:hypothetical protein